MKPRTKALLTAGPLALVGTGFIALAAISVPYVGILILLSLFASASSPTNPPTTLVDVLGMLCIPAHLAYLGFVTLAAANRRVSPGSRVANLPILGLSVGVLAMPIPVIVAHGMAVPPILIPLGLALPALIIVMRFVEKPSAAARE